MHAYLSSSIALRTGFVLVFLFSGLQALSPVHAQTTAPTDNTVRLRADTRLVEIQVSVRDAQGRAVEDLKKEDFTVTDNGKPRAFTIFGFKPDAPGPSQPESPGQTLDEPQTIAAIPAPKPNVFTNVGAASRAPSGHSTIILLDGVNGWFDNFVMARQGVLGLLNKAPADEQIALYVLVKGVGMVILQDYTTDRSKLAAAVKDFVPRGMPAAPPYMPEGAEGMMESGPEIWPGRPSQPDKLTAAAGFASQEDKQLAVAVASEDIRKALSTLSEMLKSLPGRKSVFWVTQGFPPSVIRNENQSGWDKTYTDLNDSNIEVNTVDANGVGGPPRFWGPGAILTLQQIAEKTGGKAYFYRNDLDAALASGIADSRTSYALGFYLTALDGKYHELKVQVDRPGLQLEYRRGYYAEAERSRDYSTKSTTLRAALLNPSGLADVGVTATVEIIPGKPRGTVATRLQLNPESISIKATRAGYTGKIEVMFLEMDASGRTLGQFSETRQLIIGASDKPRFDARGFTFSKSVPQVAGAAKLYVAVRDTGSGRIGSLVIPLLQVSAHRPSN